MVLWPGAGRGFFAGETTTPSSPWDITPLLPAVLCALSLSENLGLWGAQGVEPWLNPKAGEGWGVSAWVTPGIRLRGSEALTPIFP